MLGVVSFNVVLSDPAAAPALAQSPLKLRPRRRWRPTAAMATTKTPQEQAAAIETLQQLCIRALAAAWVANGILEMQTTDPKRHRSALRLVGRLG